MMLEAVKYITFISDNRRTIGRSGGKNISNTKKSGKIPLTK